MKTKRQSIVVSIRGEHLLQFLILSALLLVMIFSISGLLTSLQPEYRPKSTSIHRAAINIDGKVLYRLIGSENHSFLQTLPEDEPAPKLSSLLFKLSTNVNLDDPRSLLGRELPGYSLFDGKILVAGEGTNYTNLPIESAPPMEVLKEELEAQLQNVEHLDQTNAGEAESPLLSTGERKMVYIYFSHTRESFLPYLQGVTDPNAAHHSKINVTNIGDHLKEQLESLGIGTVVDKTDIMTKLNEKGLKYAKSYDESREVVETALSGNRDLTYLIDIHRDSLRKEKTTKVINGKSYAKLAFVIGSDNPHFEKNFKLANEIHQKLEEHFPGLSRGIIERGGARTNGKFNQDLSENAILIEFGGVDNTFEELFLSAEAFAKAFSEVFWDAESVNMPIETPTGEN